jgi:hypothetical protein
MVKKIDTAVAIRNGVGLKPPKCRKNYNVEISNKPLLKDTK